MQELPRSSHSNARRDDLSEDENEFRHNHIGVNKDSSSSSSLQRAGDFVIGRTGWNRDLQTPEVSTGLKQSAPAFGLVANKHKDRAEYVEAKPSRNHN